jgi:hypothetical protein
MKTVITLAVFLTGISVINAQNLKEAEIPEQVKNAFQLKHPGIKDAEWEKEGENFEAKFNAKKISVNMENGKSVKTNIGRSLLFSASGVLLQTEDEIKASELPLAINDYINKNLSGKKVNEAAKITDAEGKIMYEAEIGKEDYLFDDNGNFLKKEVEDDDHPKKKKIPF